MYHHVTTFIYITLGIKTALRFGTASTIHIMIDFKWTFLIDLFFVRFKHLETPKVAS